MSTLNSRLEKLEQRHGPFEKVYFIYFDSQGQVIEGSPPELIGLTREDARDQIEADQSVNSIIVWIPDNSRKRE
jgi:hypothetical protein